MSEQAPSHQPGQDEPTIVPVRRPAGATESAHESSAPAVWRGLFFGVAATGAVLGLIAVFVYLPDRMAEEQAAAPEPGRTSSGPDRPPPAEPPHPGAFMGPWRWNGRPPGGPFAFS